MHTETHAALPSVDGGKQQIRHSAFQPDDEDPRHVPTVPMKLQNLASRGMHSCVSRASRAGGRETDDVALAFTLCKILEMEKGNKKRPCQVVL